MDMGVVSDDAVSATSSSTAPGSDSVSNSYKIAPSATVTDQPSENSIPVATNLLDFQKSVSKRLDSMTDRQDSIQALSMWMIHHKTECQKIAACWLAAVKRAKVNRRLLLFYLANDVVQTCKKKNAKIYLLAFKNVLKDAVVLVRDTSIKHKIERIFHIWEERKTYINSFIDELRELLNDREKVTAHVSAANFKPKDVIESIRKVRMLETHVLMKRKQVENLKLDASKIEAVKLLKDRSHSHDFAKQFDDSYNKIQSYVKVLENEIEQRSKLVELLENGQTFYEVQNDDAMVVANAYRNFGIRINNIQKRLTDYKATLSDGGDSPMPSPSAEAPSPGNTPPQDIRVEEDMELSDVEDSESGKIIAAEPYKPSSSSSLTDRLAAMGSNLPGAVSNTADPRQVRAVDTESYSPAEQLQREKSGNTEVTDHKFLFSMVAAKTQPNSARAVDRSVLKNLTDFAEKVKNPPPKDWSEFNRKQIEKAKALVAAQQEVTKQLEEKKQQQEELEKRQQSLGQQHQEQSFGQQQSPMQENHQSLQSVKVSELSNQHGSFSNTPVSSLHAGNEQSSPKTLYSQSGYSSSSNVTTSGSKSEEFQSISWPPRQSDTPPPDKTANDSQQNLPNIPSKVPKLTPPVRPPSLLQVRRPLAPHIQIRDPTNTNNSPAASVQGLALRAAPPPPPPPPPVSVTRSVSSEQQSSALDLLDSIHAGNTNVVKKETPSDHIVIRPQFNHMTSSTLTNQGIPIRAIGTSTISPVINRNITGRGLTRPPPPPNFGNFSRFPRPPPPPPAKRPYDYGNYSYY